MELLPRVAAAVLVLLSVVACAGYPSADQTSTKDATIVLRDLAFHPAHLTVLTETTVTWSNADLVGHHIVTGTYELDKNGRRISARPDGDIDAELAGRSEFPDGGGPGELFSKTFEQPGTYTYYESSHRSMNGTIRVVLP